VDPQERREALQSQLAAARDALDTDTRKRALEAEKGALLRVVGTRQAERPTEAGRLFSPENYALFEERAKRRRVQHRLIAAQAAMAHRRLREAAAALEEIRQLDPELPELPALAGELEAARRSRGARRLGPWAMAVGVILAVWAMRALSTLPPSQTNRTAIATAPAPAPAPAPPPDSSATTGELTNGAVTANETMVVPSNTAVDSAPAATTVSPPVVATPQTVVVTSGTLRTTGAAAGSAPAPAPRPPPDPAESVPVRGVDVRPPQAPVVDLPSAAALSTPVPVVPANIPAAATAARTTDEADLVRQVLQQYRSAYERLDAASARAVWPGVNEVALARAFGDLESQTLTFQNCDVRLQIDEATATCHGTTRYVPRVGGREPRVEPRRWTFTLRRFGSDWRIETVRAER
jgi:hypothetical protein